MKLVQIKIKKNLIFFSRLSKPFREKVEHKKPQPFGNENLSKIKPNVQDFCLWLRRTTNMQFHPGRIFNKVYYFCASTGQLKTDSIH